MYSLLEKDLSKSLNPAQSFTFMIDETDTDTKPKPPSEIKNTVYQEIKQKNFLPSDRSIKKIHIKLVDQIIQD